jgi:two-component system, NarL family, nitrate/nitrite response regulator NarL
LTEPAWRVLIVDDHPVVRRGLRAMLENEAWVAEVTEAASVADAVRAAVTGRAQVVAMDIALPDGDGVEATRRIVQAVPDVAVLMLTMTDDEETVGRALRAGARGYMLKDTDPDTVVDALRTVAGGGLVLGPRVAAGMLAAARANPRLPAPFDRLTERERDIVARLAAGESNARIARHLGLSEKTVRNHLTAVFTKLEVSDRVQAALLAREAGIA